MESLDVTEESARVIATPEYVKSTRRGRGECGRGEGVTSPSVRWHRGARGGEKSLVLHGLRWGRGPVRVEHEGVDSVVFLFCVVLAAIRGRYPLVQQKNYILNSNIYSLRRKSIINLILDFYYFNAIQWQQNKYTSKYEVQLLNARVHAKCISKVILRGRESDHFHPVRIKLEHENIGA